MFKVTPLNDEVISKLVTPVTFDYVDLCDPKNPENHCVLIEKYAHCCAEKIKNFEVYEDDIWVVSFPKCGTTWTQEMVWLLNNDLDYETALDINHYERFPFIESEGIVHASGMDSVEPCRNLPRPRHIKTHLPPFLLPNQLWSVKPKIIYTTRNPKDVAISFYHHFRHIHGCTATRAELLNAFLSDKILYAPFKEHALEFWKLSKENPNILFLFYEDMIKDLNYEVKRVAKFLGKNYTQDQVDKACDHLSFESMRKNPSCNFEDMIAMIKQNFNFDSVNEKFVFIREGQSGSHKKEMTEDEIKRFDEYMKHPEFEKHGFAYKF